MLELTNDINTISILAHWNKSNKHQATFEIVLLHNSQYFFTTWMFKNVAAYMLYSFVFSFFITHFSLTHCLNERDGKTKFCRMLGHLNGNALSHLLCCLPAYKHCALLKFYDSWLLSFFIDLFFFFIYYALTLYYFFSSIVPFVVVLYFMSLHSSY